jgi:hypothetical protein
MKREQDKKVGFDELGEPFFFWKEILPSWRWLMLVK